MTTEKAKKRGILSCDEGGLHDLVYQGRIGKRYRCQKCGEIIDKAALQAETN